MISWAPGYLLRTSQAVFTSNEFNVERVRGSPEFGQIFRLAGRRLPSESLGPGNAIIFPEQLASLVSGFEVTACVVFKKGSQRSSTYVSEGTGVFFIGMIKI